MASHRSAIYLWDIPRPPDDPPELILPQRYRQATLEGVVVHRPCDLRDLGSVLRRGIPTVKLLRALCDLGAVDPPSVHPAVGHVVTNRLASPNSLFAAIRMHGRRGRPGVPALRDALADWMVDGKFLDSELERRMKRLGQALQAPHRRVSPTDLRLRDRLPPRRHGDLARVRRLGVPRQAPSPLRGRPPATQRAHRCRLDRRQLHVVDADPSPAVGGHDHRRGRTQVVRLAGPGDRLSGRRAVRTPHRSAAQMRKWAERRPERRVGAGSYALADGWRRAGDQGPRAGRRLPPGRRARRRADGDRLRPRRRRRAAGRRGPHLRHQATPGDAPADRPHRRCRRPRRRGSPTCRRTPPCSPRRAGRVRSRCSCGGRHASPTPSPAAATRSASACPPTRRRSRCSLAPGAAWRPPRRTATERSVRRPSGTSSTSSVACSTRRPT